MENNTLSSNYNNDAPTRTPLMLTAWSQTSEQYVASLRELQEVKENETREVIRLLVEEIKENAALISEIHATTAPALFTQDRNEIHNNTEFIITNNDNNPNPSSIKHLKPEIKNDITTSQENICSSAESVQYIIIDADGTESQNENSILIPLSNEAMIFNSTLDSRALDLFLNPEGNLQIIGDSNAMEHQVEAISSRNNLANKTEVATNQLENLQYIDDEPNVFSNIQLHPPLQNLDIKGNICVVPPTQNNNMTIENISVLQNIPLPTTNNNFQNQSGSLTLNTMDLNDDMVSIGPNNTRIAVEAYKSVNWNVTSLATRALLMAVFDRKVLATHSMTGKPSPAYRDFKKPQLNVSAIDDIIYAVMRNCNATEKEVRTVITTKCADENKTMKLKGAKEVEMNTNILNN